MPQSLANVAIHLVFSTKDRQPFLADEQLRDAMHRQLGGASKTLSCSPMIVGGVEDHVHLLARLDRTITIAEWVKELKRVTSLWIKENYPQQAGFQWQSGYGAFSVSQSETPRVKRYIENQEEHHRERDFKTEFRLLLERHEVPYDERYVWD
ncbi:MAG: IS200/IS605 family transposase [Lacipirellulaceae bacterium]